MRDEDKDYPLDHTSDVVCVLSGISNKLFELHIAFSVVGNDKMSERLFDMGQDLRRCIEAIGDNAYNEIERIAAQTQRNSTNLLRGVLAGSYVGAKEEPSPEMRDFITGKEEK